MVISSVKKSKRICIHQAFLFFLHKVQEPTRTSLRTKKKKSRDRCLLALLWILTNSREELNTQTSENIRTRQALGPHCWILWSFLSGNLLTAYPHHLFPLVCSVLNFVLSSSWGCCFPFHVVEDMVKVTCYSPPERTCPSFLVHNPKFPGQSSDWFAWVRFLLGTNQQWVEQRVWRCTNMAALIIWKEVRKSLQKVGW